MEYHEYLPSLPLRRFIECFWTISNAGQPIPADTGEVMPDGAIEVVLNFADAVRRGVADKGDGGPLRSMIVGQLPRSYRLHYAGKVDLLGTRFWPSGAYPFLGLSLHELSGRVVHLGDLLDSFQRQVTREVDEFSSTRERIRALEHVLLKHLAKGPPPDAIAEEAVRRIQTTAGGVTVSTLMAELGVSGRRLERVFRRHVGVRPKLLCRILRFRQAREAAEYGMGVSWAALALRCGYYDQAHLIREFPEFTGVPPTKLFGWTPEGWSDAEMPHMSDSSKTTT